MSGKGHVGHNKPWGTANRPLGVGPFALNFLNIDSNGVDVGEVAMLDAISPSSPPSLFPQSKVPRRL